MKKVPIFITLIMCISLFSCNTEHKNKVYVLLKKDGSILYYENNSPKDTSVIPSSIPYKDQEALLYYLCENNECIIK